MEWNETRSTSLTKGKLNKMQPVKRIVKLPTIRHAMQWQEIMYNNLLQEEVTSNQEQGRDIDNQPQHQRQGGHQQHWTASTSAMWSSMQSSNINHQSNSKSSVDLDYVIDTEEVREGAADFTHPSWHLMLACLGLMWSTHWQQDHRHWSGELERGCR